MGFLERARKMAEQAQAKISEPRRQLQARAESRRAEGRPAAGASARPGRSGPRQPQRSPAPVTAARPR
jgi:hypothetical protein